MIDFLDVAGSVCGALLPTGNARDVVGGVEVTLIDNGMPVVVLRAEDFGVTGAETPKELEANARRSRSDRQGRPRRRAAHEPRRCDAKDHAQDVARLATSGWRRDLDADLHPAPRPRDDWRARGGKRRDGLPDSGLRGPTLRSAWPRAQPDGGGVRRIEVEHPTGSFLVEIELDLGAGETKVKRSALLRTARKIFSGNVFIPSSVWNEERNVTIPATITLIGFGEVGQIFARGFLKAGITNLQTFDIAFAQPDAHQRRAASELAVRACTSAAEAVRGSELVISAVTAAATLCRMPQHRSPMAGQKARSSWI